MAGSYERIDDREVLDALAEFQRRGGDTETALRVIGEKLLRSTRERFSLGHDPRGNAWKPLSPEYRRRKLRNKGNGYLLVLNGRLRDLLRYEIAGASLKLGTDRMYGATHQFGDPRRHIPARPYLGISEADRLMILEVLNGYYGRAFESG